MKKRLEPECSVGLSAKALTLISRLVRRPSPSVAPPSYEPTTRTTKKPTTNESGCHDLVEQSISVPIIDNATAELPETFQLNLSSPSANAEIGNSVAVATIIDNDATAGTPVVTINDFVVDEATQEATFVITLDRPSTGVVSMSYATQNGGALAGSDYVATSGSLNFAAGETAKTVKVTLLNDTASESSEAFNLVLSALSGATSLDPVGTAIIAQNDAAR
jgi:hypothetical protein